MKPGRLIILLIVLSIPCWADTHFSVCRQLPSTVPEGAYYTVNLSVVSDDYYSTATIREFYTSGDVSDVSYGGVDNGGNIKWDLSTIYGYPPVNATLTYRIVTEDVAPANKSFGGYYVVIDSPPICGDTSVMVVPRQTNLIRDMPTNWSRVQSSIVTLSLNVSDENKPSVIGVTEYIPTGWSVLNISHAGTDKSDRIEWLILNTSSGIEDQNLTYTLVSPDAKGLFEFRGTYDDGNYTYVTSKTTKVDVDVDCSRVGDKYPCGQITLSEVIDLISLWSNGEAALSNVVTLIAAWAS